jgi:rod shape determining protein RodA
MLPQFVPFLHYARAKQLSWPLMLTILALAGIGFTVLYSAGEMNWQPWAGRQMVRFAVGLLLLLTVACVELRVWQQLAYPFYLLSLLLLLLVDAFGFVGMGAQRWLKLGPIQVQPSELMKIAIVMALARYFAPLSLGEVRRPARLLIPVVMILFPALLVAAQPDLGGALMLLAVGGVMLMVVGARWWKFAAVLGLAAVALPILWHRLHDYQKKRLTTFLNPDADPLGAGYHITQSKIALGNGGILGKGLGQGTQSYLDFLPEKHTDFIFTMVGEELGLVGALIVLTLYTLLSLQCSIIGLKSHSHYGRLVAIGIGATCSIYLLINTGMVMGLLPVVGEPLPLLSYGGTAMLTILIALGMVQNVKIYQDQR